MIRINVGEIVSKLNDILLLIIDPITNENNRNIVSVFSKILVFLLCFICIEITNRQQWFIFTICSISQFVCARCDGHGQCTPANLIEVYNTFSYFFYLIFIQLHAFDRWARRQHTHTFCKRGGFVWCNHLFYYFSLLNVSLFQRTTLLIQFKFQKHARAFYALTLTF